MFELFVLKAVISTNLYKSEKQHVFIVFFKDFIKKDASSKMKFIIELTF